MPRDYTWRFSQGEQPGFQHLYLGESKGPCTFHDRSNACNLLADILEEREVSELLQKGEALSNGCSQITLGELISALPSYSQLMMGHTFCVPIGQEQAVVEEFLLMAT